MIVYLLLNTVNNKGYIGQHIGDSISGRWNDDLSGGHNRHLERARKMYGPEIFSRMILNACSSQEEMDNLESLWILTLRTYDPDYGYNVAFGGNAVPHQSGLIWINNGVESAKLNQFCSIPEGWKRGRIIEKKSAEEMKAINAKRVITMKNTWANMDPVKKAEHGRRASVNQIGRNKRLHTEQEKEEARVHSTISVARRKQAGTFVSSAKGRIWITDDVNSKMIISNNEIPANWHKGRSRTTGENISKAIRESHDKAFVGSTKNRFWITNGVDNKLVKEISELSDSSWYKGMTNQWSRSMYREVA